ncbi:MAG: hypothetical protein A3J99_06205 [Sideroxydans sp. RIFOXYD2_FULL_59_7]|nr:MAG: hypothetical protein A3J99_06205 [Sideroxydans sp. RIFOXYD2_FULL_59_7]
MHAPFVAVLSLLLALTACSRDEPPPPAPKLFAEQRNALEQAKGVGALQQEAAEQQREAMEQQTQ